MSVSGCPPSIGARRLGGQCPDRSGETLAKRLLLLLIWSPWALMAALFCLNLIWLPFRYRLVSVQWADAAASIALLRWISSPVAATLLAVSGRWALAVLALFWPFVVPILGVLTRPQVGRLQLEFMRRLGYEPTDLNPLPSQLRSP